MKRSALYAVLGVVALAAIVAGVVLRPRLSRQPEQVTRSTVVKRGTLLVAVSASGSVEPETRVGLAFETPGRVSEVTVDVGDRVSEGDVLARLDTRQLALQVHQAEAALAMVEAQLTQLQSGPRPEEVAAAEANLRAAGAQVGAAAANRDQVISGASSAQIAGAEAQVASARLQQKIAQDAHDRLIRDKSASDEQKQQAAYDLYAANTALKAAQAQLDDLLAGADAEAVRRAQASVEAAVAQRDAAQAQLELLTAGPTRQQVADLEGQVAQARAALDLARLSLDNATLRAPFDGIVAAVNVKPNETAPVGLPAITLLDASSFHLTLSVDEMDVGRLAEGLVAEVMLDALPGVTLTGTVERIAPVATLEGGVVYYEVIVDLDPTDAPIRADMTANATIVVEELSDVLTIPTWVVRVDRVTGQTYVRRQVGDKFERVDVTLGVRYKGVAEVLDGLSEGDVVALIRESTPFGLQGG